ncbi:MAG: hypothetical protein IKU80_06310 [Firmicutes bacterium]|nr:hypothetical protein [Bacillota bacterium]
MTEHIKGLMEYVFETYQWEGFACFIVMFCIVVCFVSGKVKKIDKPPKPKIKEEDEGITDEELLVLSKVNPQLFEIGLISKILKK